MSESSSDFFNPQAQIEGFQKRMKEINATEASKWRGYLLGKHNGEKIAPPKNPQQSLQYQIDAMLVAGFHKKLGLSDSQYKRSLPELPRVSSEISKKFSTPVLIDPRIPISAQLSGFDDDITEHGESPNQIINRPGFTTPNAPYIVWVHDGSRYKNLSLKELNLQLQPNERALTFSELLALQRANVELFFQDRPEYHNDGVSISAGNSITSKGNIPTIYHNYFQLKENGEFQVDAFSDSSIVYPHRPTAGWPTTCTDIK